MSDGATEAVQSLADRLERLGAPLTVPEDWIMLCDDDDLRFMRRSEAKKLLVRAKKETARRWLYERFDSNAMELELSQDGEESDEFDERALKRKAIDSIDDVVRMVSGFREMRANLLREPVTQPLAHEATVAARLEFGYPKEPSSKSDCFDDDVRRQCLRVIDQIYSDKHRSGPVVYVISAGDLEFVKIGFTASFEQRLRSLKTASHADPVVHVVIPGTRSLERDLHARFASARQNREWFRLTPEIEAFIASERAKG
jgi:Meiotically up-regulated gene 113